jgi:hypothetical protein
MALDSPPMDVRSRLVFLRWRSKRGFPSWRFAWWLLLYVEDSLARLPMLLLGPTAGAVIGTAVAVSELSSVTIDGKRVATVPSVWDVLLPALLGGIGGLILLTLGSALWGLVPYFTRGDDTWQALMPGQAASELVCKTEVPVGVDQLGAMECVVRRPCGELIVTDDLLPRTNPYGVIAHLDVPLEAGTYQARWYATEHRRRIHEVARVRRTFAP